MFVPELVELMNMISAVGIMQRVVRDILMLCVCAFTSAVVPTSDANTDSVCIDLA